MFPNLNNNAILLWVRASISCARICYAKKLSEFIMIVATESQAEILQMPMTVYNIVYGAGCSYTL